MKSLIQEIPNGIYKSSAWVDSDGVINEPLEIKLAITKKDEELEFDFSGSSKPCKGPMNSVLATTMSSVYLAMRHIFPEVPINGGAFIPLNIKRPSNTFLDAHYPRPVSGCAAEVSQRIAEAVFIALVEVLPSRVTAAPAGTSGNFALGGFNEESNSDFVMYQLSGGGYGGNSDHDGLANGCSTIGISKAPPVEIMEQKFPVLYHHYALHEGSGGAGKQRGGFGLDYKLEILCNNAQASFVMDHGRYGPQGVMGGTDGQVNVVNVEQSKKVYTPIHLSKEQDIQLAKGDTVHVKTPGGGGYGSPFERNESLVLQDVKEEKYSIKQAIELFGVSINENDMEINKKETKLLRRNKKII